MNRILLFLLLFLASLSVRAQNLSVASFKALPNDLDARVNFPLKDQNGDVCAIIKVVTTESGFSWDGDQLGITKAEKKVSEYWLYVPYGAKRLTIKHERLGQLRDYRYPEAIAKASVYEMVLVSGKIKTIVEEEIITTWLTIISDPEGADLYINDVLKGITPLPVKLAPGKYTYRVEKPLYYSGAGSIRITGQEKDGKIDLPVVLKPAFGSVQISTLPEGGATVLIDDVEASEKTPSAVDKVKSGVHKITVRKEMFQPKSIELTVKDGETVRDTVTLSPNFANATITTQPEADIYIDGKFIAKGTFTGRVSAGINTFEARKENHYSDRKDKETVAGDNITLNLVVQPILGNIDVVSIPVGATVFLDGEEKGTTPLTLKKILAGSHDLKIEKSGFDALIKKITIGEGKTTDVNEKLAKKTDKKTAERIPEQPIGSKAEVKTIDKPTYTADYYKYKKSKTLWIASALVSGAVGTFAMLQAGKYYTQYQTATTDADALQKKVKLFDMISPIAFGVAGFCAVEIVLKSGKQSKARKQTLSFYPQPCNNGAGLGLAYKF